MGLSTYVWPVSVTTPLQTLSSAPLVTSPMIGSIWIDSIEIRIPPGHRGNTGIYVANSGAPIVPYSQSPQFVIANDELLKWDVGVEVDTGLQIVTFNNDYFAHEHYVRIAGHYTVQDTSSTPDLSSQIVPIS